MYAGISPADKFMINWSAGDIMTDKFLSPALADVVGCTAVCGDWWYHGVYVRSPDCQELSELSSKHLHDTHNRSQISTEKWNGRK